MTLDITFHLIRKVFVALLLERLRRHLREMGGRS